MRMRSGGGGGGGGGGGWEAEPVPDDIPDTGEFTEGSEWKARTNYDNVASRTLKRIKGVIRTQRKLTGWINAELERLQKVQRTKVRRELNCIVPVLIIV